MIEAIAVGILIVIIGTVVTKLFFNSSSQSWNKYHVMEIALFLTGFFTHLFCEFSGINQWYCKNGNACQR